MVKGLPASENVAPGINVRLLIAAVDFINFLLVTDEILGFSVFEFIIDKKLNQVNLNIYGYNILSLFCNLIEKLLLIQYKNY